MLCYINDKLGDSIFDCRSKETGWFHWIDIALQMRKEADDIGPSAELDHWRKRMAKFNRLYLKFDIHIFFCNSM